MAALQTLRNKPALLMSVIGGALLLFIVTLTDLNSCSRPNVEAEVNGQELTYENYEAQVRDEENVQSLLLDNLSDDAKEQIRQQVWNKFLQNQILAKEADKLGLIVTKEDIQNALASITPQELQQLAQMMQYGQANFNQVSYAQRIMLLMARYMGQPSIEAYKQFMKQADQQMAQLQKQDPQSAEMLANIKQACLYCESQIPTELLAQKYMGLIAQGAISNPISAKMDFEENNTNCNLEIASMPYSAIADNEVKISDDDLKAKYEACKELYRLHGETRDLKLINVTVVASPKDQANIVAQVKSLEDTLRKVSTGEAVEGIMRGAKSDVPYNNAFLPKDVYTQSNMNDVVEAIDSLSVGATSKTKIEPKDRNGVQYVSTFKLVGVKTTPDSMQICQLAVGDKKIADQLVAAAKGGKSLSELAKDATFKAAVEKYGLKGDTTWNATKYYVEASAKGDTTKSAYTDICQMSAGTIAYYTVSDQQGQPVYVVTSVLSTKAPSAKYNIAVVKYPIKFSTETYNEKRRALNEFLAKNTTIESLEKNAAKAGYTMIDRASVSTTEAMNIRYSIGGEGAKQAFMWAFDEAKAGEVSRDFECGKNSDQLLVIAVSAINDGDYLAWDNANVKAQLRQLVMQDKKAEIIMAKLKNVNSIAAAKATKGVDINTQPSIALAQMSSFEPALTGAIERTAKGKFTGAVKGSLGIFFAQVNDKTVNGTFNAASAMMASSRATLSRIFGQQGNIFDAMINKTKIVDKRYKF